MNRADLLSALASARAAATALEKALAELDAADIASTPRRFVDTATAARIVDRSYSWLYANARRYALGHRLPSGSWTFDADRLRAFRAGIFAASEESDGSANSATASDSTKGSREA